MATYTVTHKQLIDNYAVLQLLTPTEIEVGQSITVSGIAAPFRELSLSMTAPNTFSQA